MGGDRRGATGHHRIGVSSPAAAAGIDPAKPPVDTGATAKVVKPMGIGIQGTVYGDTWAHAVPRVYTNPDHVFTAHNGENLALVCWVQGDLWHSTYSGSTDVIWDLVIDRDRSNGAGYINQADVVGGPPRAGVMISSLPKQRHPPDLDSCHTAHIHRSRLCFRRGQGHVDLMVCYINGIYTPVRPETPLPSGT